MTHEAPAVPELRRFVPLGGLSDAYLAQVAETAAVVEYPEGSPLSPPASLEEASAYLMSGSSSGGY